MDEKILYSINRLLRLIPSNLPIGDPFICMHSTNQVNTKNNPAKAVNPWVGDQ